jgi:sugar phosphate isomerase/epimerase
MQNPIAVSSWSLHQTLGYAFANGPADGPPFERSEPWGSGQFDILQLPAELAKRGYHACEICHFHIGALERPALEALAQAFATQQVVIQTLLIDDGDLTNPATLARDKAWISRWIEAASILQAQHVRVIAGKAAPTPATLSMAVAGLREMVTLGERLGVHVVTENWHDLLATPTAVHHVLDHVPGLGFMADTGNWAGAAKYSDLTSIFARADLCHAKAHFEPGLALDQDDFSRCLQAACDAAYQGPMTLIFADVGEEWAGLETERQFIRQFTATG